MPDFVIGDRDGQSAGRLYRKMIVKALRNMGYRVHINTPYKGAEILKRYGRPFDNMHAIQIEINKHLYLNDDNTIKEKSFTGLQNALTRLINEVAGFVAPKPPSDDFTAAE
jgi:N-formylglutamate amidohydrolase